MACTEWRKVFSVEERRVDKFGLLFFFPCHSVFSNFLTFHLVKKGRGRSKEQEKDSQKGKP